MMNPKISEILAQSGVVFGTSGARGLVEQFTYDVCAAFTAAFLCVMGEQGEISQVAIGLDRRPSSPTMAAACSAAARALGVEVVGLWGAADTCTGPAGYDRWCARHHDYR